MRPVDDLAFRARTWFWYWTLRNDSGLSNDGLDDRFLSQDAKGGRKRHFERIEQTASSPASFALKDGKTLLKLVDEGGFPEASQVFNCRLWEFLTERDAPPQTYSDYIAEYIDARGWHRIGVRDLSLYITFLGDQEPAVQQDVSTVYSAMLHKLMNETTLDGIAVLVALFREAMAGMLLQQAIAIKSALGAAVVWTCRQRSIPKTPARLLSQLIDDRVFSNRWFSQEDWRVHTGHPRKEKLSTRERVREFKAWVQWYIKDSHRIGTTQFGLFPIVPRSERIHWIEENGAELQAVLRDVGRLKEEHWMFSDSLIPRFQEHAESSRLAADALLKIYAPPDSKPEVFYESEPPFRMGNLLQPY